MRQSGIDDNSAEARSVQNAMSFSLTVASPETSLKDATDLMEHLGVPVIVVYDGRSLVGVLSDREVALHGTRQTGEDTTVRSVMRTNVLSCFGDDRLADALSLMQAINTDWLPVLDHGDHLMGILSRDAAH